MLTLNLLKFTDTKGWIHMAHKQDIQADTEEKASVGKELFQWVLVIIGAVILAFLIDTFVIVNAQIPSGSMENKILRAVEYSMVSPIEPGGSILTDQRIV